MQSKWLHNMCRIPRVYLGIAQVPSGSRHQSTTYNRVDLGLAQSIR